MSDGFVLPPLENILLLLILVILGVKAADWEEGNIAKKPHKKPKRQPPICVYNRLSHSRLLLARADSELQNI